MSSTFALNMKRHIQQNPVFYNILDIHRIDLHDGVRVRFPCDKCDRNFASERILQEHISFVHDGISIIEYPCCQCEYKSWNKSNLKRDNEDRHSAKSVREVLQLSCNKCENKYKSTRSLHLLSLMFY